MALNDTFRANYFPLFDKLSGARKPLISVTNYMEHLYRNPPE